MEITRGTAQVQGQNMDVLSIVWCSETVLLLGCERGATNNGNDNLHY